jgi:hypothetical protein
MRGFPSNLVASQPIANRTTTMGVGSRSARPNALSTAITPANSTTSSNAFIEVASRPRASLCDLQYPHKVRQERGCKVLRFVVQGHWSISTQSALRSEYFQEHCPEPYIVAIWRMRVIIALREHIHESCILKTLLTSKAISPLRIQTRSTLMPQTRQWSG